MDILVFVLLGLGAGSLYATLAQSAILTFKGSGFINIAVGAMAMYVAYTFAGLRQGRLMLPPLPNPLSWIEWALDSFGADVTLPDIPAFVEFSAPVGIPLAIVISLIVSVVVGLAAHALVFNPLRNAPPLAKTVASAGVLLTLQAVCILRFGTTPVKVTSILPSKTVLVDNVAVPVAQFIFLGVAVVVTVVLGVSFRYLRIGWAIRAAAEDQDVAAMVGLHAGRLAALSWMVGSLIAGAVGLLYASVVGLDPTTFTLFAVPALGAALLARMSSFGVALVTGVVVGCAQSCIVPLQADHPWIPQGAAQTIPFIVIIIAMVARSKSIPDRATAVRTHLPDAPEPDFIGRWFALMIPVIVVGLIYLPFDLRSAVMNSMIGCVLALSCVVITGFAGQISLMQIAFAGIAAVAMTRISGDWGVPFPLDGIIAVLVAGVLGVLIGLPALRVRGAQLAVLTLAAASALQQMVFGNTDVIRPTDYAQSIDPPGLFGLDLSINSTFAVGPGGSPNAMFGFLLLAVTSGAILVVIRLRRSLLGRQWLAVRSNERAAAGLGVNVSAAKLSAFAIGACLAGLAGVLASYQFQGINPSSYAALVSVSVLAFAYLGGIGSVSGAVVAGTLVGGGLSFRLLDRLFELGSYEMLIGGMGLILAAILNPEGIVGVVKTTAARATRAVRGRRRAPSESGLRMAGASDPAPDEAARI